ncbi:toll/interleukin-1 receptor domain-containing protein [Aquimarina aquimarini]|uniref:toll/interleukin-1 receptor domain-containing protein n=1 Tax=Aquimarina aquimarini TaxID=1191734 RepID=UPI000D55E9E8|nr:toll/interleukin-1 receptor domain-containing protein [Aquimarina aquimarini]
MNTLEKKNLSQEISLYTFAKYKPDELLKKMKGYGVPIPDDIPIKRQQITKILQQQEDQILQAIRKAEQIRPLMVSSAPPTTITQTTTAPPQPVKPKKIFISHSKEDLIYVQQIINVLERVGIGSHQIFCSSYEGYGTPLGSDYLKVLKEELQGDTLVLFVLSQHFFDSKICLCEMGATWILTQKHIPIYIPPFTPENVGGVLPTTQGMQINKKRQLIILKERLEKEFEIQKQISFMKWDRQIDDSLRVINEALKKALL